MPSPTPSAPRQSAHPTAGAGQAARGARRQAVADVRRALVLEAARAAFHELGLERASLREIAKRAGYTPGAIYRYFASKEEVYAALLGESLERLNAAVAAASPAEAAEAGDNAGRAPTRGLSPTPTPTQPHPRSRSRATAAQSQVQARAALRAHAAAFFEFYRANPRDLDLGFYLARGVQPRGLTTALNEPLNARLRDALAPVYAGLVALGASPPEALAETTALFAHAVGVLVLGHSGRIRMFLQDPTQLFERYLDALLARAGTATLTDAAGAAEAVP